MGETISSYFAARDSDAPTDDDEDTSALMVTHHNIIAAENHENCLQYLKRKFTYLFCCHTSERKRKHSDDDDDEDEGLASNKITKVDEADNTADVVQINDAEVQNIQETAETPIIEDIDKEVAHDDQRQTCSYLSYPFLTDIPSMASLHSSLTMIIMRGLPGSGKSTIVRKLMEVFPEVNIPSF